jgi:hypothetical protein
MTLAISNIVTAFDEITIGTKVVQEGEFTVALTDILQTFEFPPNGQGFIPLPCLDTVSCGVAKRSTIDPLFPKGHPYVIRQHRGEVCLFAHRRFAAKCESLVCIVYTAQAYKHDAQVSAEEIARIRNADFVLVAILASAGPKPPVSSHRFTRNLAGGNNSYKPENGYSIEKAIAEAAAIVAYEQEWITVAD